ncbi:hypothetical protein HDV57DRAFT_2130 [Trichoderma longibrachiatum]
MQFPPSREAPRYRFALLLPLSSSFFCSLLICLRVFFSPNTAVWTILLFILVSCMPVFSHSLPRHPPPPLILLLLSSQSSVSAVTHSYQLPSRRYDIQLQSTHIERTVPDHPGPRAFSEASSPNQPLASDVISNTTITGLETTNKVSQCSACSV